MPTKRQMSIPRINERRRNKKKIDPWYQKSFFDRPPYHVSNFNPELGGFLTGLPFEPDVEKTLKQVRKLYADDETLADRAEDIASEETANYDGMLESNTWTGREEPLKKDFEEIADEEEDWASEYQDIADRYPSRFRSKDISSDNDSMIAQMGLLSSPESKSDGGFAKTLSPGKDGKLSPTQKFAAGLIKDFFTPKEEAQQQVQATSKVTPGRSFDISPLLAETKRPKRDRYRNKGLLT